MDHIGLIVAIVGSVAGGTWALRSKLADVESALKEHVTATAHEIKQISARVIKLEGRQPRRQR